MDTIQDEGFMSGLAMSGRMNFIESSLSMTVAQATEDAIAPSPSSRTSSVAVYKISML